MWDCHWNNRYKIKWKTGSISPLVQTQNTSFISHMYLIQKKYFEIDNICTFIGLNFSRYLNRQLVCSIASPKQEMFMSLLGNEARTQLNIVQGYIRLYNSQGLSHTWLCSGIKAGRSGQHKGCRAEPHFKIVLFR